MKLTSFKIILLTLVFAFIGLLRISGLSFQLHPSTNKTNVLVSYYWPNATAVHMDEKVTSVLESALSELRNLKEISSLTSNSRGSIRLQFKNPGNRDMLRYKISSAIMQVENRLPEDILYPKIIFSSGKEDQNTPFITYALSSDKAISDISEIIRYNILPGISAIPGVREVVLEGMNQNEILLTFNHNTMEKYSITRSEILQKLQNATSTDLIGEIENTYGRLKINLSNDSIDIGGIPISKQGNRNIYLEDIVNITNKESEPLSYYRVNGLNSVTLNIYAEENVNTIRLAEEVFQNINKHTHVLPPAYHLKKVYDSTEQLEDELITISTRFAMSISIIFFLVFLLSRELKYVFIIFLSITTNIALAFLFYDFFNVEIQIYSLAGITISLGIIIDNSIIVIDHMRNERNTKVLIPLIAATLTTIGAIAVIFTLNDDIRLKLVDFALVIIINLLVSLYIGIFFIPAIMEKIPLKVNQQNNLKLRNKLLEKFYRGLLEVSIKNKKLIIVVAILLFGIPLHKLPEKLDSPTFILNTAYNNTIGEEYFQDSVLPYLEIIFGGTLRLFSTKVYDGNFNTSEEERKLTIIASMGKGLTVHHLNETLFKIEEYLKSFKEISYFNTTVTSGNYGKIDVHFKKEYWNTGFPIYLKNRINSLAVNLDGLNWNIYGIGQGYSNNSDTYEPISYRLEAKGYNYRNLNYWADSLKSALGRNQRIKNVVIRENTPFKKNRGDQYYLKLNKNKMAHWNLTAREIYSKLTQLTLSKNAYSNIYIDNENIDIKFVEKNANKFDLWNLKNNPLNIDGSTFKIKDLGKLYVKKKDEGIRKKNQEYTRLIEYQYVGSEKFGQRYLNEQLEKFKTVLPLGYSFKQKDELGIFNNDEKENYLLQMILIIFIIYSCCAILFEDFFQPLIIVSMIPISLIGGFLAFYLGDFNFDQGGMASFLLLAGITVNASIFILNEFNELERKNQKNNFENFISALRKKTFPIFLTILSTIVSFIPFVIGNEEPFWFSMGIGTIGGLIFSLVGIFYLLPVMILNKKK